MAGSSVAPIIIPIVADASETIESFDKLTQSTEKFKTVIDEIKNNSQSSLIPGFGEDIDAQAAVLEKNIELLTELREKVLSASDETSKNRAARNYESAYNRIQSTIRDLKAGIESSQEFSTGLSNNQSAAIQKILQQESPSLRKGFHALATNLSKSGTMSDDTLVKAFMNTDVFKQTVGRIQSAVPGVNRNAAAQLAQSYLATAVPRTLRNKFVDWDRGGSLGVFRICLTTLLRFKVS